MKKRIIVLSVLLVITCLLFSCANPETLVGTKWTMNSFGTAGSLDFYDGNTVKLTLSNDLMGINESDVFTYTYSNPDVTFIYDDEVFATGKVSGLTMSFKLEDVPLGSLTFWKE